MDPARARLGVVAALVVAAALLAGSAQPRLGPPVDETAHLNETVDDLLGVSYLPENDSVRIVLTSSGRTSIVSYEEYACRQAASAANRHVRERLEARFDDYDGGFATGVSGDGVVVDDYSDGGPSHARLERATPERVAVTVHVFEKSHTCTVPVSLERAGHSPQPGSV